uniref:B-cell antigen receptor complex-associated protein alpha chain isoform X1 n=1 Tax=Monopterus albus TaxID=43700 RepID=UPI0009B347CB|nr:B-cell antigen receptor complex-associated protein alpha chain isoform X1 [Monopterus albus]
MCEKIERSLIFVLCCLAAVGSAQDEVTLELDKPFLDVSVSQNTVLECCFNPNLKSVNFTWFKVLRNDTGNFSTFAVDLSIYVSANQTSKDNGIHCGTLTFTSVQFSDTGLYRCLLNYSVEWSYTHGTYLQVSEHVMLTGLSESTKNKILTAEGILLLLCVLLPSAILLRKSKRVSEQEKKKAKKEEENIYQGLNLDDCCTTYDQIERSQAQGPYQDVCNIMEEEEIQLEKP